MKTSLLHKALLLIAALFTSSVFAQDWVSKMQDPTVNFYDVQKSFNQYYSTAERQLEREKRASRRKGLNLSAEEMEVPGYSQYKRWEYFMQPRVSATGERFAPDAVWKAMSEYKKGIEVQGGAGNWTSMGPVSASSMAGAGRLNFLTIDPQNASSLWVGAPAGGLWHSTNGGTTWTTNTDWAAQVIGYTDLAIDPTNSSIMYAATGDGDAGDTYAIGLLKSTDGGATWNPTGLSFAVGAHKMISRVLVDPSNTQNILVATSTGIFRSTNGGTTFASVQAGTIKSMEFKPGASSTVYACGTEFFLSNNSGATWTKITSGLPTSAANSRMKIAVTAAAPTTVYVLCGAPAPNYGMQGLYKSTTSGSSFTTVTTSLTGFDATTPGQEWYDFTFAVSPASATELIAGAQTLRKSTNGGTAWSTINGSTHVDYHNAVYVSGSGATGVFYVVSDGGIFKTTNGSSSWTDLSSNLGIAEMYGFGQLSTNANKILTGHQDNGTNLYNGSTWTSVNGGDGTDCFVDRSNDQIMYAQMPPGSGGPNTTLLKSTNGGASFPSSILGNITEQGGWNTRWSQDPVTAGTIYAGFVNLWKSTTGGGTWTKLGTIGTGTATITSFAVSPASTQVIWVAKAGALYKTTNGGTSWTTISAVPNGTISDILCHPTDANKAWITYSGFSNSNKVFQTTDQGTTWTNLSGSVPNIPVNCITMDKNGNDALYIGTDAGCFFKDATMTVWQPFSNQLPNVIVSQLAIFYGSNPPTTTKIRASTYGRGMWQSDLFQAGAYPPDANFGANNFIGCPGLGVQFTDYSSGSPNQWVWSFPGGNPSSSTAQNPFVAYNTPGTYSVSLTATNTNGSNTQTFTNLITISSSSVAPTAAGKTMCGPATVTLTASNSGGTTRWWNKAAGGNILSTGTTYTPLVNGTTTFYVDEAFNATSLDLVGPTDKSLGGGSIFSASDIRGLYFDVLKPVILNSVRVYANSTAKRTIEIIDDNGNAVTDTTLNIPANATTGTVININRTLYPGTNYFIKFRGTVDCWRNSDGAAYPFNDGGSNSIVITNSNAGSPGYYYFFYDWHFTNIICNTGRTAVVVTDTCSLLGINDLFVNNHLDVFPNPNNGQFTASFHTDNIDNYVVKVTNTIGQTVYEEKLNNFSGTYSNKIDITLFSKGVYMLSVSNSRNETVKKVLVY